MMLSEEAGETPSSDLLVELAAEFDVLSIWNPDLNAGDGHHIRRRPGAGSTTDVGLHWVRTTLVIDYWDWLQVIRTPGMLISLARGIRGFK